MPDQKKFFARFKFDESKAGMVGVEREQFVFDKRLNRIVPRVPDFLDKIEEKKVANSVPELSAFGYELSACQLESKIGPCTISNLGENLEACESFLKIIDNDLGLTRLHTELAPEDMPLDIYPDPTGRYQVITQNMPREILEAACRVAATHVHVGMPNMATAIEVFNKVIFHTDHLMSMGDSSRGVRFGLYKVMAKRYRPEPIQSPEDWYTQAVVHKFDHDPRSCWTMIRISIHGTIEFRMFGATASHKKILEWASVCHSLCTK